MNNIQTITYWVLGVFIAVVAGDGDMVFLLPIANDSVNQHPRLKFRPWRRPLGDYHSRRKRRIKQQRLQPRCPPARRYLKSPTDRLPAPRLSKRFIRPPRSRATCLQTTAMWPICCSTARAPCRAPYRTLRSPAAYRGIGQDREAESFSPTLMAGTVKRYRFSFRPLHPPQPRPLRAKRCVYNFSPTTSPTLRSRRTAKALYTC